MNLLKIKKNITAIEDNDSDSENIDVKTEIKSEVGSSSSERETDSISESENEVKDTDSEKSYQGELNAGWVDSVTKILKTKKPKNKRALVLSKAKKLTDVAKKEKPVEIGFQIDGETKEEKLDLDILDQIKTQDEPLKKKRKEISTVRAKPNILDKDRERTLSKIATRGVVQLFNAVRSQQKDIDNRLQEAGPLERKRESAMKNIDKRAFLDVLMQKKSERVDSDQKVETKVSKKSENQSTSTWSVLRDDFMMGAKMKDWDKETEEASGSEVEEISDSD